MKPQGQKKSRSPTRNRRQQQQHMMRLDALTIAGLTGAAGSSGVGARVAIGTGASGSHRGGSRSPARSDATLSSIEDSFKGGSSILSDELGEIVFTDDELDVLEDDDASGGAVATSNNGHRSSSSSSEAVEDVRLPPRGRLGSGEISRGDEERGGEEICRKEGRAVAAAAATATATAGGARAAGAFDENVRVSQSLEPNGSLTSPTTAVVAAAATAAGRADHSALRDTSFSARKSGIGLPTLSNDISSSGDMLPTPQPSFRPPCATVPSTTTAAAAASPIPSPRVSPPFVKPSPNSTTSPPGGQPQPQQQAAAAVAAAAVDTAQELEHHRRPVSAIGGASNVTGRSLSEQSAPATRRRHSGDGATLPKVNTSSRDRSHGSGTALSGVGTSTISNGGGIGAGGGVSQRPRAVPTATCKVLVVGNAKCGKSSIISRFVNDRFSSDYNSTIGADYAMKDVYLRDGRQVRLQLWDIAGQDRFAKLTRAYFRKAKGAVVVCDVTREGTFDAIVRWKEEIDLWSQNEGCELPVYLFANKCDLLTEVQDSFLAGARMEKTCRESSFAGWYITSAKRGDNIDEAMTKLLEDAIEMEGRKSRENEAGQPGGSASSSSREAKGEAFELSSAGGLREGGQGIGQSCCA